MPCFIISPDIDAIKCKQIELGKKYDSKTERVSQFYDEWHVRDEITLDKIIGISLPFDEETLRNNYSEINEILQYAKLFGWEVFKSSSHLVDDVNASLNKNKQLK